MSRVQTRAQHLGIQPGRLSMRTRRRLDGIRALITAIAVDWDEADSGVCMDCDMLRDQVDAFEKGSIAEGLGLLREPFE